MKCERIYRISERTYTKRIRKKQVDLSVGRDKHLFAIIVQCLFSKSASSEIFHAKWGAGDILTYASTVALGLLAVWQNQKIKEESDRNQLYQNLLAAKNSDDAIVTRIIDDKTQRVQRIRSEFIEFEHLCNTWEPLRLFAHVQIPRES